MFNKKYILILSLLIVCICAISAASAADNLTDAVAADDADAGDTIAIDDADEVAANIEENTIEMTADDAAIEKEDENNNVLASEEEQSLSKDESSEAISAKYPVSYNDYKISFKEVYEIQSAKASTIQIPITTYSPWNSYNFILMAFYDNYDTAFSSAQIYGTQSGSFNLKYTFAKNSLKPGTYILAAANVYDQQIMDYAVLAVGGTAVITANTDYNANYYSGATMSIKIADKSGKGLRELDVNALFSNGKTSVLKTYTSDSNGVITFVPPVGVGTWTVTFDSDASYITTNSVQRTVVVKKSGVSIKAFKVTEYKGHKITLKAKVTSYGKNVNEGIVTFKINGKTYKASVKNGIATVKVKLKKIKTYKYSAKFTGDNFIASKTVKSKATLKKSYKTKIYGKNKAVYIFKKKTVKIVIKTKQGKKVKNGKLKVTVDGKSMTVNVKNGVAKIKIKGLSAVDHFVGFTKKGETYKKYITKKVKLKYIPATHKYKSSSAKIKVTSVFKCPGPGCGKTYSHYHWGRDSYGVAYKHFYAIV
jgi:hypothetical protein